MVTRFALWFAAILVAGGVFMGCATTGLPANATFSQKIHADAAVMGKIANDVKTACGPQFAPTAPIVVAILSVAADPYNALNDVMQAIGVIPLLAQDVKAAQCVVKTVRDDIHAFFSPAPAAVPASAPSAELQRAAEMGTQVLELLNQGATVTVASVDGGAEISAYTP